ncbi:tetratricopeptide repeat protein [Pelomonas nitida]|uniref:Tetratricopeptide repeat protein n=1 Tax=Pelomonas nitida TaxID=3299027 RepID=A0ABW7G698_9BURK
MKLMSLMKNKLTLAWGLLLISVGAVYGLFLWSPVLFDDLYFFDGTVHEEYLSISNVLSLRWLPYASFEWTRELFGLNLLWFRLGNLAIHLANLLLFFVFLKALFKRVLRGSEPAPSAQVLALCATALWALHPASVYAVAYLTQRSTLMATLFVLAMLLMGLRALDSGRLRDWASSIACYALATLSKELAVMAPMLVMALAVLLRRDSAHLPWRRGWLVVSGYLLVTAFVTWAKLHQEVNLIGAAYQLNGSELLSRYAEANPDFDVSLAYPLSVLTQASLFFKYLLIWLFPSASWMSVDMYEPLATSLRAWPYLLGLAAFMAWGFAGLGLLWRGGRVGLAGFGLLCPWLMFFTEFSTVRVAEPFVIYRSYLWMFGLGATFPWLTQKLSDKTCSVIAGTLAMLMVPTTMLRLQTFSNEFLLWDDAVRLVETRPEMPGIDRVYANRGNTEARLGLASAALKDYDKAISIYPGHANVHSDRGAALLMLRQYDSALTAFQKAIELQPDLRLARIGAAQVFEKKGDSQAAIREYKIACTLGSAMACKKLAPQQQGG